MEHRLQSKLRWLSYVIRSTWKPKIMTWRSFNAWWYLYQYTCTLLGVKNVIRIYMHVNLLWFIVKMLNTKNIIYAQKLWKKVKSTFVSTNRQTCFPWSCQCGLLLKFLFFLIIYHIFIYHGFLLNYIFSSYIIKMRTSNGPVSKSHFKQDINIHLYQDIFSWMAKMATYI